MDREIWNLTWQNFIRMLHSAKFYMVTAVTIAGLLTCFEGVATYLLESASYIHPYELYLMSLNSQVTSWIIYAGIVVLLSDAPFRYPGDTTRILKSSRTAWITAQFLFSNIIVIAFYLFIGLFFAVLTIGHWCTDGGWSETAFRSIREGPNSIGIVFAIYLPVTFLAMHPVTVLGISLLLQWEMAMVIACVIMLLRLIGIAKAGLFLAASFPFVDYMLLVTLDFPWSRKLSEIISPYSLSALGKLQPALPNGPTVKFAVMYLGILLILLCICLCNRVRNYDFYGAE